MEGIYIHCYINIKELYGCVSSNTGREFTDNFINQLHKAANEEKQTSTPLLPFKQLYEVFDKSSKRLLVLICELTYLVAG
jgi:hypothetical protein